MLLQERIWILIVLVSAVTNKLVNATRKCDVREGFDIDKLNGTWHYVAGINPKKALIRCETLNLTRVWKYNLAGYKVGFSNGKPHYMTITAYVRDNIMDLRSFVNDRNIQVVYMWMRTCNGESEFALENPRRKFYWIFSRGTTASPVFLKYYRLIAKERGLRLRRGNNTYCAQL